MRASWGVHGGDREVAEGFPDPRPDPHTDASRFSVCKAAPGDLGGAFFSSRRGPLVRLLLHGSRFSNLTEFSWPFGDLINLWGSLSEFKTGLWESKSGFRQYGDPASGRLEIEGGRGIRLLAARNSSGILL